jgi:hypothetical protein
MAINCTQQSHAMIIKRCLQNSTAMKRNSCSAGIIGGGAGFIAGGDPGNIVEAVYNHWPNLEGYNYERAAGATIGTIAGAFLLGGPAGVMASAAFASGVLASKAYSKRKKILDSSKK